MCSQSDAMRQVRKAASGLSLVCLLGDRSTAGLLPTAGVDFEALLGKLEAVRVARPGAAAG